MGEEKGAGGPHPDRETLGTYVDDRLSDEERQVIEDHLVGCVPCREVVANLFAVVVMLGGLDEAAPPRSFRIGGASGRNPPSGARFRALRRPCQRDPRDGRLR